MIKSSKPSYLGTRKASRQNLVFGVAMGDQEAKNAVGLPDAHSGYLEKKGKLKCLFQCRTGIFQRNARVLNTPVPKTIPCVISMLRKKTRPIRNMLNECVRLRHGMWKRRYFALRGHHLLCAARGVP